MKTPSAIIVGDMHLGDQSPICRTDDFIKARNRKVKFIKRLQQKYNGIPVITPGDVFDHWKASPELLRWCIENCPTMLSIPGQHDLPNHALDEHHRSGFGVLEAAGIINFVNRPYTAPDFIAHGFSWGDPLTPCTDESKPVVALAHFFTYVGDSPFPGCSSAHHASSVLKKLAGFDLVVTGDNHSSFTYEHKGRLLVNPGSMMRTSASQASHEPYVLLWWADTNEVKKVPLPFERGVVSREHLDVLSDNEERLRALKSNLNDYDAADEWAIQGFEDRLKAHLLQNPDISKQTVNKIHQYTEERL
jgi:DNA repair exonuclease SbcCD nuclease subunit